MIDDKVYFSVQAWMVTKLKLKGCERDVFAIIYGYSQDGESDYHGSLGYLAELTGYSKNSICTALKNLTEKEFIIKTEKEINNIKFCGYQINCDSIQATCMPVQVTCINNNQNNKIDNNNSKELLLQNSPTFTFGKQTSKKDSLYTKCVTLVDSYDFSTWGNIRKLLIEYLRFRLSIKDKPLYTNMWKGMLNKLSELCNDDVKMYESVIKQSIERGYLSFYPVSDYNNKGIKTESGVRHVPRMTEEDYAEEEKRMAELESKGVRVRF